MKFEMTRVRSFSAKNSLSPKFRKILFKKHENILFSRSVLQFVSSKQKKPEDTQNQEDLYSSIRLFLILGKLIGLVPIQGLFQKDYRQLKLSKSLFSWILGLIILLTLAGHVGLGVYVVKATKSVRADEYAWSFAYFLYFGLGFWIFLHFYRHNATLVQLIYSWNNLQMNFTQIDANLFRDVSLVASIVMTSGVGENVFVNLRHIPTGPEDEKLMASLNITSWELYFKRANTFWASMVPFHHATNLFLFLSDKLVLYAWTFTDITIVIFSRALYFKFQALYFQGKVTLLSVRADSSKWELFTRDFETLRRMLNDVNAFLSPMIFANFAINIYFLCLQFHNSVNPYTNSNFFAHIYAFWAVGQVALRTFLVSVAGARINDWVQRLGELIRMCPDEFYNSEVERTENYLNANTIGLGGLGCFIITKPMMLKVAGVVFSFEVVLLQALQLSMLKLSPCSHNTETDKPPFEI